MWKRRAHVYLEHDGSETQSVIKIQKRVTKLTKILIPERDLSKALYNVK